MVERFTFDEIKNLQIDNEFWVSGNRHTVTTLPSIQQIEFYGDTHQKAEWKGYCEGTMREMSFAVADNDDPYGDNTYPIYKTATSHSIEGTSNIIQTEGEN